LIAALRARDGFGRIMKQERDAAVKPFVGDLSIAWLFR
jgi:hypothetical protein